MMHVVDLWICTLQETLEMKFSTVGSDALSMMKVNFLSLFSVAQEDLNR